MVRAKAERGVASRPWSKGGLASTRQGAARSDSISAHGRPPPGCRRRASAPPPTTRAGCAPPARGQSAGVFCHCQPTLFSASKPVSIQNRISLHYAPASDGARSVSINPRLVLTLAPGDDYRSPKASGRRSERRSSPDEGAAWSRNRPARASASRRQGGTPCLCAGACADASRTSVSSPTALGFSVRDPSSRLPSLSGEWRQTSGLSGSAAGSIHLPGLLAGMTRQATGMARSR